MKLVQIDIKNKIAELSAPALIVCGNSDYVVEFNFDEEWAEHPVRTARFSTWNGYTDVVFEGTQCPVPVLSQASYVKVGVFAGDLCTTTPAYVPCKKSIRCEGGPPIEPPPDVYAQLIAMIENGLGGGDNGDYVKKTDYATNGGAHGLVKIKGPDYGIGLPNGVNGQIAIVMATSSDIDGKSNVYRPIVSANLEEAVRQALANCKSKHLWTSVDKKQVRELLDITGSSSSSKTMIYETTTTNVTRFTPINTLEMIFPEQGHLLWDTATTNVSFEIAFYDGSSVQSQTIEMPPLEKLNKPYSQMFLLDGKRLVFELEVLVEGSSGFQSAFGVTIKEEDDVGNLSFVVNKIYVETD